MRFLSKLLYVEVSLSRIIAVSNQKGGVAKTTTVMNLGAALASMGKRVLVLDSDPQANLTVGFGLDPSELETTLTSVLAEEDSSVSQAIYETYHEGLQIVPSDIELADVEFSMANRLARESILKNCIGSNIREHYDVVLLDAPPNLGMLTTNVLVAATDIIIPVATHFYALQGLETLLARSTFIRERLNPELRLMGLLATRFDARTNLGKEVVNNLKERELPLFESIIHEDIKLAESPALGKTIFEHGPETKGAKQYLDLAIEVMAS